MYDIDLVLTCPSKEIHLSMGTAFGNYENEGEFRQIIAEADNNMYQVKAKRKKNSI